mmetsp:Transcript_32012/g.80293  ORF Transcript_32012/g.80293 Transcript_32012/m.80293 type:complete len:241 (+) Transcript_32012:108-830(+)
MREFLTDELVHHQGLAVQGWKFGSIFKRGRSRRSAAAIFICQLLESQGRIPAARVSGSHVALHSERQVLVHAQPVLVHVPQAPQCMLLALLRSRPVPLGRRPVAHSHAQALLKHAAKVHLCPAVALPCRALQPARRAGVVRPAHTPPLQVQLAHCGLRLHVSLLGGLREPKHRLRHAVYPRDAALQQEGQMELRVGVALQRGAGKPPGRLTQVALHPHAAPVCVAQLQLGCHIAILGSLP